MPKYILNVAENWYRRYLVECDEENQAVDIYQLWLQNQKALEGRVSQLGEPDYIDDGPMEAHFVEGIYDDGT